MSNLSENRVNTVLSNADITAITEALNTVAAKLPAICLTDIQRQRLKSINVDNKIFVEDTIMEINANGANIIPPYITKASIQNDLVLFEQLEEIESYLKKMAQRVADGKRAAGDGAYGAALAAYRVFDEASKAGIMNAKPPYEKLKARFAAQGRKKEARP